MWNSYLSGLGSGVSLCGIINIQYICAQWLCWESLIWSEYVSRLPSEDADSYHLGRKWAEIEGLEPVQGVIQGFYAQWLSLLYWGQGQHPKCWSRSPERQIQGGSIFLTVFSHLTASTGTSTVVRSVPEQEELDKAPMHAEVLAGTVLESQPEPQAISSSLLLCTCQKQLPSPHSDGRARSKPALTPKCILPWQWQSSPFVWYCTKAIGAGAGT